MVKRGNTNNSPQFFKFFLPRINDHQLRIPRQFVKHMKGKIGGTVSLMGPNKSIWHVELIENTDGVFLQNGWHDFVRDHSLQVGYCLVFRYYDSLHFTVQIFDTSACNKDYDSNIKPCNDSTGFGDHHQKKRGNNPAKVLRGSSFKAWKTSSKNRRGENYYLARRRSPKEQLAFKQPLCKKPHGKTERNMIRTTLIVHPNHLLGKRAEEKRRTKRVRDFTDFVSQRRPVTKEEIARALENARSFKSKDHFATIVMRKTYVYVQYFVNVPMDFVRLALPKVSKMITLYCPNRKTWKTKYIHYGYRAMLSAGWRSFAVGNNLEEHDVCVFEAISEEKLVVHIFRVVDEITPLKRKTASCVLENKADEVSE